MKRQKRRWRCPSLRWWRCRETRWYSTLSIASSRRWMRTNFTSSTSLRGWSRPWRAPSITRFTRRRTGKRGHASASRRCIWASLQDGPIWSIRCTNLTSISRNRLITRSLWRCSRCSRAVSISTWSSSIVSLARSDSWCYSSLASASERVPTLSNNWWWLWAPCTKTRSFTEMSSRTTCWSRFWTPISRARGSSWQTSGLWRGSDRTFKVLQRMSQSVWM